MPAIPVITTIAGLALGVWGGLQAVDAIRIDLPGARTVRLPGGGTVSVPQPAGRDPESVRGTAPESLLHAAQVRRVRRTLAAAGGRGRQVHYLRLAAGRANAEVGDADGATLLQVEPDGDRGVRTTSTIDLAVGSSAGFAAARIDPRAPGRIVRGMARLRRGVSADDVDYMVLSPSGGALLWVAFLKSGSPRSFLATAAGRVERANG